MMLSVVSVCRFFSVRANKFAKWKTGLSIGRGVEAACHPYLRPKLSEWRRTMTEQGALLYGGKVS